MATLKISLINDQGETTEARAIKTTDVVAAVLYGELDAVLSKMDRKLGKAGVPKSEQLTQKAAEEDNDLVAMGIHNKALREKRLEKWEEDGWKQKLISSPKVINSWGVDDKFQYSFHTTEFGTVDYYIKINKVLIRKDNKWIKPGLQWLKDALL